MFECYHPVAAAEVFVVVPHVCTFLNNNKMVIAPSTVSTSPCHSVTSLSMRVSASVLLLGCSAVDGKIGAEAKLKLVHDSAFSV